MYFYHYQINRQCKQRLIQTVNELSFILSFVLLFFPVPVSNPVLSVVGGKIFIGKRFQLICHSHTGTFPIKYTLFTHNGKKMSREVSRPEDRATFDIPPIYKISDLKTFLCHASNNPRTPSKIALGEHLLKSTNIIGKLYAVIL